MILPIAIPTRSLRTTLTITQTALERGKSNGSSLLRFNIALGKAMLNPL
jgi:hypothetical protein